MATSTFSLVSLPGGSGSNTLSSPIRDDLPFEQVLEWITEAKERSTVDTSDAAAVHVASRPFCMNLALIDDPYDSTRNNDDWQGYTKTGSLLRALNLPDEVMAEQLAARFNYHPLAFKSSSFAEISSSARTNRHYSVADSYFGVAWCWNEDLSNTTGVMWCFHPGWREQVAYVLDHLVREQALLNHPVILAQLVLRITVQIRQHWVSSYSSRIVEVQEQTGYHYYDLARATDGPQDLNYAELSAEVSAVAINLSTNALKLRAMVNLARFIIDENDEFLECRRLFRDSKALEHLHGYMDRHAKA